MQVSIAALSEPAEAIVAEVAADVIPVGTVSAVAPVATVEHVSKDNLKHETAAQPKAHFAAPAAPEFTLATHLIEA